MRKLLHEVDPREQDGRDAVARFKAQYRAAAYQSLLILKGGEVDAVFCDIHDDYVVRKTINGVEHYDFYQVKTNNTKGFQWKLAAIFGINTKKAQELAKVKDSFVGKLMLHTVQFGEACLTVNLQSNKDFDETVYEVEDAFVKGGVDHKNAKHFFGFFNEIHPDAKTFTEDEIKACLAKLRLIGASTLVEIDGGNYLALTRQTIVDNSEFDMQFIEFKEIALKLLALVEEKSVGKISEISDESIKKSACIALDDVLGVMAISPSGYRYLLNGGDPRALKNTSIIQRVFQAGGATTEMIESFCKCKSHYDIWLSSARHYISTVDFQMFSIEINEHVTKWLKDDGNLKNLLSTVKTYKSSLTNSFSDSIDDDICWGAFLAEIVRQKT